MITNHKKILILGKTGLLAQAVNKIATKSGYEVFSLSRGQGIELTNTNADLSLYEALERIRPSLIFNATGITNLQFCEQNPTQAWLLHARLPGLLAKWTDKTHCPWVHVSTDHYFNDSSNLMHTESDPPKPLNEYASSKLAGEALALTSSTALVLRTNIIGKRGWASQPNFAEWVMKCLNDQEPFNAFIDTWASSIEAGQFAYLALKLAESGESGLMNLACSESISKSDLIEKIAKESQIEHYLMNKVKTPSHVAGQPRRANAMGLNCTKAEECLSKLGLRLPDADEVVSALVKSFKEQ
jgi:dTDP-4-dehydrorhamnose reductase